MPRTKEIIPAHATNFEVISGKRPIEVGIDLDNGAWFFVRHKGGQKYKLAPTAKEQTIRIYSGSTSARYPKLITTSDPLPGSKY